MIKKLYHRSNGVARKKCRSMSRHVSQTQYSPLMPSAIRSVGRNTRGVSLVRYLHKPGAIRSGRGAMKVPRIECRVFPTGRTGLKDWEKSTAVENLTPSEYVRRAR